MAAALYTVAYRTRASGRVVRLAGPWPREQAERFARQVKRLGGQARLMRSRRGRL